MRAIGFGVISPVFTPVVGAAITLDDRPSPHTGVTDANGYVLFPRVSDGLSPPTGAGTHVTLIAEHYEPYSHHLDVWPGNVNIIIGPPGSAGPGQQQMPPLVPDVPALQAPQLEVHGKQFTDGRTGQEWIWAMCTDFSLLRHVLDGRDISPVLRQRLNAGANGVRVLGMCYGWLNLSPLEAGYWTALTRLFDILADHGMACEFVAFAAAQNVMADVPTQQQHFAAVVEGLNRRARQNHPVRHVVIELCNEWKHNGIDPNNFQMPRYPLISSRGSPLSDDQLTTPPWTYGTLRERREWPKYLSRSYKAHEECWALGYTIPVVFNEPIGASEIEEPGRRSARWRDFRAIAAGYRAIGAGATFHSEAGLRSEMWGPKQLDCAKAFFEAMR